MANASKTSGFFHTIKEKLFHGEKHVDNDYELVYGRFATLQEACIKLKQNSNNYISSIYSLCLNTNNVSIDFATLLEDAARPNEYQTLAQQFRTSHNRLNSEKQQLIVNELNEKVIKPLDGALATYSNLQTRITQRNQLHTDLEYYLNKVHELNNDRDERTRKGKTESQSQIDKFDRNQTKLNDARTKYTEFATTLMADLTNAWEARIAILGPAMASFVQAEKLFLQIYATELNEVNRADTLTTAPASVVPQPLSGADVLPPHVAGDVQFPPTASPLPAAAPHVASTTSTTIPHAPSAASTTSTVSSSEFKVSPPPTMAPLKPYTSQETTEHPRSHVPSMSQHDQMAIARADGEGMLQQTHSLSDQEHTQHEQLVAASASSIPATAVAGGDDALNTHGVTTATCVDTATAGGPAPAPMLAAPYAGNAAAVNGNPFDDDGNDAGFSSVAHSSAGIPPPTGTATTMPADLNLNVPGGHTSGQMPLATAPYAPSTEGASLNDRFAVTGIIPKSAGEHEAKRQYEQEQKSNIVA